MVIGDQSRHDTKRPTTRYVSADGKVQVTSLRGSKTVNSKVQVNPRQRSVQLTARYSETCVRVEISSGSDQITARFSANHDKVQSSEW